MKLTMHIDGGSRGNPGPAGAGVAIRDERDRPILEAGFFLGRMTNNMAEYNGLLRALEVAEKLAPAEVRIISDSELLVRQLNGEYRVRNENLRDLFDAAMASLRRIGRWKIEHVRREYNQRADELANLAMDMGEDVIEIRSATLPAADEPAKGGRRPASEKGDSSRRSSKAAAGTDTPPELFDKNHVQARCIRGADPAVCPAPCKPGDAVAFDHTVPAGICLGVAGSLISAVETATSTGKERQADCPRKGCGATFVVLKL